MKEMTALRETFVLGAFVPSRIFLSFNILFLKWIQKWIEICYFVHGMFFAKDASCFANGMSESHGLAYTFENDCFAACRAKTLKSTMMKDGKFISRIAEGNTFRFGCSSVNGESSCPVSLDS